MRQSPGTVEGYDRGRRLVGSCSEVKLSSASSDETCHSLVSLLVLLLLRQLSCELLRLQLLLLIWLRLELDDEWLVFGSPRPDEATDESALCCASLLLTLFGICWWKENCSISVRRGVR